MAKKKPARRPNTSSARSTVSGPSRRLAGTRDAAAAKMAATELVAEAFPFNAAKPSEFGKAALTPQPGQNVEPPHPSVGASTLSERNTSAKTGKPPSPGANRGQDPLERVRVDSSGRALTTNQGVTIGDNQNSLKAGLRGPSLLEDFILREKITHFDHERIPERIVHARGSAAHGYFECYKPLKDLTRASLFAEAGKRTPVL
jgi:catalase